MAFSRKLYRIKYAFQHSCFFPFFGLSTHFSAFLNIFLSAYLLFVNYFAAIDRLSFFLKFIYAFPYLKSHQLSFSSTHSQIGANLNSWFSPYIQSFCKKICRVVYIKLQTFSLFFCLYVFLTVCMIFIIFVCLVASIVSYLLLTQDLQTVRPCFYW